MLKPPKIGGLLNLVAIFIDGWGIRYRAEKTDRIMSARMRKISIDERFMIQSLSVSLSSPPHFHQRLPILYSNWPFCQPRAFNRASQKSYASGPRRGYGLPRPRHYADRTRTMDYTTGHVAFYKHTVIFAKRNPAPLFTSCSDTRANIQPTQADARFYR